MDDIYEPKGFFTDEDAELRVIENITKTNNLSDVFKFKARFTFNEVGIAGHGINQNQRPLIGKLISVQP